MTALLANVFGPLQRFRERPLPDQDERRAIKVHFRTHPLRTDTAQAREPLVDISELGVAGRSLYAQPRNPPYYQVVPGAVGVLYLRQDVARRLAAVNGVLREYGLEVFVVDGWRPNSVQAYFHDVWTPEKVREAHPDYSDDEVTSIVQTYWSAPTTDASSPAPHMTGGAVDLTLRWIDGELLWMGGLIDDPRAISYPDAFERVTDPLALSDLEAKANRRLLHWLMHDAGLAANPHEWWHFSYGDQMWARLTGQPAAIYGAAEP